MNNLAKIFLAATLLLGMFIPANLTSAAASAAKVYRLYTTEDVNSKFSQSLPNGLTVTVQKLQYRIIPAIYKGKKKVWTAGSLAGDYGAFQFTVTKNKDTFFFYSDIAGGGIITQVVGIHSDGKLFFMKKFSGGAGVDLKFQSSDKIEVAIERLKKGWNPSKDTQADRYTDIWDLKIYSISHTGKMTTVKQSVQKNRTTSY